MPEAGDKAGTVVGDIDFQLASEACLREPGFGCLSHMPSRTCLRVPQAGQAGQAGQAEQAGQAGQPILPI